MAVDAGNNPETDLVISRVLNAPRAALWRAWTDPELLRVVVPEAVVHRSACLRPAPGRRLPHLHAGPRRRQQ